MLAVSSEYIEQMNTPMRNRSYQWINLKVYNVNAANDVTPTSNGHTDFSDMSIIMQEQQNYSTTYATLEPMRFLLDGTQLPIPLSGYIPFGFVSESMSDENGFWKTNPLLTLTFGGAYGFSGLTLMFDPSTGDYLSELIVSWYSGDVLLVADTIYPTSSTYILDRKTQNITKITIECVQSSTPERRARIQKVLPGITDSFDNSQIDSTSRIHDVDPMARRLPTETFTFTILDPNREYDPDNPAGLWEYVDVKTPISVVDGYELNDGTIEQLESIQFQLDGKPTKQGMYISFSAKRLLGTMTETYRKGIISTGRTLKALAEDVLVDALGEPYAGETWWILDDILDTIETTAPIEVLQHNEALQQIANAGMCALYTNAAGQIVMKTGWMHGSPVPVRFNNFMRKDHPTLTKVSPLYAVDALYYQYAADSEAREIFKGTLVLDGTASYWFDYSAAQDISISVTRGTLVSKEIYTHSAYCTITGAGEVTVVITGYAIQTSTTSSPFIANPLITGETETVENSLVTVWSHKEALDRYRANYLTLRNTYTAPTRGNTELEPLDLMQLYTEYVQGATSLILKSTVNFNGALSGELIVKRITNLTYDLYCGEFYSGEEIGVL